MRNREAKNHPRLIMLDEFDGTIEGELKYHKCLYKYRRRILTEDEWAFKREERGPTDPGFTSVMQSMEDLGLVESDEAEKAHRFHITEFGERVSAGIRRGVSRLDPEYSFKLEAIREISVKNKNKSGSELEEDEEIQEAKEETYQSDV